MGSKAGDALADTLAVFERDAPPGTPLTTSEVAEQLAVARRTAYERLDRLVERDDLETKKVGARGRVWWRPRTDVEDGDDAERVATDAPERAGAEREFTDRDRQFRSMVEATEEYAIFMLDVDGRVVTWNAGAERIKGYERDEILGERVAAFYTDEAVADGIPERNLAVAAADGAVEDEGWRVRKDGSLFWANVTITAVRDANGDLEGYAKVTRDMSDRRRYEQRLRRQRDTLERELDEVFERIDDAFYAVDDQFRFTYVNERAEELLRHSEEELLGVSVWERFPEATETAAWESFRRALEDQESTSYEIYFDPLGFWVEASVYPSETGLSVYFRDVTDRKEYERALEESERRYRTMAEHFPNGAVALFDESLRHTLVEGQIFDALDVNPEDLRGACVSEAFSPEDADAAVEKYRAALRGESSTFDAAVGDRRFRIWTLPVTDEDGNAFAGMAMGQDVTEREEREAELKRQRKQLAALNGLNETVRRTTDAIIEQSTREEIEATVCEHLAATDSYLLAWIGDVDVQTQTVNLRTSAGVENYLDGVTVSVDPDDERSDGPTGRAVRTGGVQTTQDVRMDSRYEPWRDHSVEFGFRSSAAIPIVHEDAIFGVLNVYADRPNAFTGEERRVIGQLGEIVGHAIASVERKQALMADDVTEIEMRARNVFETIDLPITTDETITLDRMVPVEDQYLVYGTATGDGLEVLDAVVEQIPYWERVHVLDERFEERKFEARLSESPVLSAVAAHGGAVERAVVEGGDYRMTIQLPQGTDVRRVIESVQATYPAAEVLARRQITRPSNPSQRVKRTWMDELTARQRTALETAYFAGFFEWPRDSSGEDVARSLDVSSPTFHQHLRAAERKLFGALFDELPATG